jgi:hypothetical protein
MWHPKQLLHPAIKISLLMGGFKAIEVEFLGWQSGYALALNRSQNPVKAAHTIIANAEATHAGIREGRDMLGIFQNKKLESIKPTEVEEHPVADTIFRDLEDQIDMAVTKAALRVEHMDDFSKGGISDGWLPFTTTPHTEEEYDKALAQEEATAASRAAEDEDEA